MILGEDKRECLECRKMLSYDNFNYPYDIDDFDEDPYHIHDCCSECYRIIRDKAITKEKHIIAKTRKNILIEKRINLNYIVGVICADAPICPKCGGKAGCHCYDLQSIYDDESGWGKR